MTIKRIELGLLYRREFRRFLLSQDINFTEEKGLLDSAFFLKCTDETFEKIIKELKKL